MAERRRVEAAFAMKLLEVGILPLLFAHRPVSSSHFFNPDSEVHMQLQEDIASLQKATIVLERLKTESELANSRQASTAVSCWGDCWGDAMYDVSHHPISSLPGLAHVCRLKESLAVALAARSGGEAPDFSTYTPAEKTLRVLETVMHGEQVNWAYSNRLWDAWGLRSSRQISLPGLLGRCVWGG